MRMKIFICEKTMKKYPGCFHTFFITLAGSPIRIPDRYRLSLSVPGTLVKAGVASSDDDYSSSQSARRARDSFYDSSDGVGGSESE